MVAAENVDAAKDVSAPAEVSLNEGGLLRNNGKLSESYDFIDEDAVVNFPGSVGTIGMTYCPPDDVRTCKFFIFWCSCSPGTPAPVPAPTVKGGGSPSWNKNGSPSMSAPQNLEQSEETSPEVSVQNE